MGEPWRDPKHFAIGGAQGFSHPFAEGGRTAAEIDRDVVDFSAQTANELSLGLLDLVMQAAYHVLVRERLVVLNEGAHNAHFRQNALIVAFEKGTPAIFKDPGFEKLDIGDFGRCSILIEFSPHYGFDLHSGEYFVQLLLPAGQPETESVRELIVPKVQNSLAAWLVLRIVRGRDRVAAHA